MGSVINGQEFTGIIGWLMTAVGYMEIMKKCGVQRWWLAFVPVAREYQISLCSNREKDGRSFVILTIPYYVVSIPLTLIDEGSWKHVILAIFALSITLARFIYLIRIYLGLCQVFARSKKWVLSWILIEGITSLVWGFSKKFEANIQVEHPDKDAGAKISGASAETLDNGLTVNIKERTALDFFKKKCLLKDIHMNIPPGHMVLLLGGSGAGKTTFVNAVTGYEKADASILLKDQDIYREYNKLKYDVGFVPQQDLMRGNDTVQLTLSDAASLRLPADTPIPIRRERVQGVLEDFGLSTIRTSLVEKLSGGQKKRLSIAMEFISDPSLFILDEPDSGLDGVVARGLFEKLRAIADSGKIVIVITHTPDRVIDLFDDVIVLAKDASRTGRLAYYGPVKEAYDFFGKQSMEEILLSINQKDEGGEGRADEFVEKYADLIAGTGSEAGEQDRKVG
ncbi:MAG: ABC transporter ATP-binding protein [Lachnospiraceae bacterium]|nr:ABC transporter ATP-binding protein [Lachnospiraceae bacterium]